MTETDRAVLVAQALGKGPREKHDWYEVDTRWMCRHCRRVLYHTSGQALALEEFSPAFRESECRGDPPKIDVTILPAIWADCEKRGWLWTLQATRFGHVGEVNTFVARDPDPVLALCEAYCAAVEGQG